MTTTNLELNIHTQTHTHTHIMLAAITFSWQPSCWQPSSCQLYGVRVDRHHYSAFKY